MCLRVCAAISECVLYSIRKENFCWFSVEICVVFIVIMDIVVTVTIFVIVRIVVVAEFFILSTYLLFSYHRFVCVCRGWVICCPLYVFVIAVVIYGCCYLCLLLFWLFLLLLFSLLLLFWSHISAMVLFAIHWMSIPNCFVVDVVLCFFLCYFCFVFEYYFYLDHCFVAHFCHPTPHTQQQMPQHFAAFAPSSNCWCDPRVHQSYIGI